MNESPSAWERYKDGGVPALISGKSGPSARRALVVLIPVLVVAYGLAKVIGFLPAFGLALGAAVLIGLWARYA